MHKTKPDGYFFQMGNKEWYDVARLEGTSKAAMVIYFYLASNQDNFSLEFSPKALVDLFGQSKRTWERGVKALIDNGFLVHHEGEADNKFHFYTTPQKINEIDINCSFEEFVRAGREEQDRVYSKIIKLEWDDMTEVQEKIHDFYLQFILED